MEQAQVEAGADLVLYQVRDLLAVPPYAPRTHEFVREDGTIEPFVFPDNRTPVEVPADAAKRLIGNPGFEVKDQYKNILKRQRRAKDSTSADVVLQYDECIAKFEELAQPALLERAKKLGRVFKPGVSKPEVIAFLVGNTGKQGQKLPETGVRTLSGESQGSVFVEDDTPPPVNPLTLDHGEVPGEGYLTPDQAIAAHRPQGAPIVQKDEAVDLALDEDIDNYLR